MVESTWYSEGVFCWADVAAGDLDAAVRFYGRVLGWEPEVREFPDGRYVRFRVRGKFVAGAFEVPAGERPRWHVYIKVDHAGDAVDRAVALGAEVRMKPEEAGQDGRVARLADPTGAEIGMYQPAGFIGADIIAEPGALTWFELLTPDPERAAAFYRELFGYGVQEVPTPAGPYRVLEHRGERAAGIFAPPHQEPVAWTPYVHVEDLEATVRAATDHGAAVLLPPTEAPGIGRYARLTDPHDAAFAVIEPAD